MEEKLKLKLYKYKNAALGMLWNGKFFLSYVLPAQTETCKYTREQQTTTTRYILLKVYACVHTIQYKNNSNNCFLQCLFLSGLCTILFF